MAYPPTNWVEKVTKVGPTNLNKLENGLQAAAAVADAALPVPAALAAGDYPVWSGGAWVKSSSLTTQRINAYGVTIPKVTRGTLAAGPPASPQDGDIWIATAVDANGTTWKFVYDSTQTTYKWLFVGGAPITTSDGGNNPTTTSATFVEGDANCRITVARAGDYVVEAGGRLSTVAVSTLAQAALGTTTSLGTSIIGEARASIGTTVTDFRAGYYGVARLTGLSASAIVCQSLRNGSADGQIIGYSFRSMRVIPVRIS